MRPREALGNWHTRFKCRSDDLMNSIRDSGNVEKMEFNSIHPEIPAFSCLKRGLFDSFVYTPIDILHLFYSNGLVMYLISFIFLIMTYGPEVNVNKDEGVRKSKVHGADEKKKIFLSRLRKIPNFSKFDGKQVRRTKTFNCDIFEVPYLQANEYRLLLIQIWYVLGSKDDTFFDRNTGKHIREVIRSMIKISTMIKSIINWSRKDINNLEKEVKR